MSVHMLKVLFLLGFFPHETQSEIRWMITVLIATNIDVIIDNITNYSELFTYVPL